MRIKFKLIPSNKNEWIGWFGEDLIKVRIKKSHACTIRDEFFNFLKEDLGITKENINFIEFSNNVLVIEMPDVAWELFLNVVK